MLKKNLFFILIACISCPVFSQTLTYTESRNMGPFNPYLYREIQGHANRVFSLLYEGLFRYDFNQKQYEPMLARAVTSVEPNVYRVELRNDVLWHDGQRFNADDVIFSYNYLMQKSEFNQIRDFFGSAIEEVRRAGEYLVEFHFTEGVGRNYMMYLDTWIIPSHLFDTTTMEPLDSDRNIAREPVGTGKYRYLSRAIGGDIEFAVNSDHYLAAPDIRNIQYERIPDVDLGIQRLLAGVSDLVIEVPPNNVPEIEAYNEFKLVPYQTYSIMAVGFNFDNPLLQKQRIRHAIIYGTNRRQMLDQWYNGDGYLLAGPYTRNSLYINSELEPYEFDPQLAEQLLRDAGYRLGSDGIMENRQGEKLELTMLVRVFQNAVDQAKERVVQDFQDMMNEIGIQINVENREGNTYLEERANGDFDLIFADITFDPNYDIMPFFHSSEIDREDGFNFINYRNDEIDRYFNELLQTEDPDRRQQYLNRIQTRLAVDAPYMFMFSVDNHAVHHQRFRNVIVDPLYFFSDIERWRVPEN